MALTAGLTGPAAPTGPVERAGKAGAGAGAVAKTGPGGKSATERHTVSLITGDRITVDARGRLTGVRPAPGRERIPVRSFTDKGRTYAVPHDAERLLAAGKLDPRFFDTAALIRPSARKAYAKGVRAVVRYTAARGGVRAVAGVAVRRGLPSLNAEAVTTAPGSGAALWRALTRTNARGAVTTAPGVDRIWLDAVTEPTLDRTTAQIGAPAAWAGSYDGTGVKIAVLDSGIDADHPDFAGRITEAADLSGGNDPMDRTGHGTHVASIALGSGAKSGGKYRGVAPGATLLSAKFPADNGFESDLMAGIDWAVARGADIVNISYGTFDSPGVDPLEALINRYSAERGTLFVVAAGNYGPGTGTLTSPGSAEAALTVGSVDRSDTLADSSGRGPRVGDGGIKPDVTAPGVGVLAAAAANSGPEDAPGYRADSGTSMAAPHVAGAAALLKQKHPDWTGQRIKAALMASAEPGPYTVHQQGAGRIAVDRALALPPVTAEPAVLDLGTPHWPHHDDTPVSRTVTYHNHGPTALAFDLTVAGTGPGGAPLPAGFLTTGASRITVPAGGTTTVDVIADTRIDGGGDGRYSAAVLASPVTTGPGAATPVRTLVTVDREVESYDVTLRAIGRDGAPATTFTAGVTALTGLGTGHRFTPDLATGSGTVRLPRGEYVLDAFSDNSATGAPGDLLLRPRLTVDRDTAVDLDARDARPVDITVPDSGVQESGALGGYAVTRDGRTVEGEVLIHGSGWLRTAHLGPDDPDGGLRQYWRGIWTGPGTDYHTLADLPGLRRFATGYTRHYRPGELATVRVGLGAAGTGGESALSGIAVRGDGREFHWSQSSPAGTRRTVRVSAEPGIRWQLESAPYRSQGEVMSHRLAEARSFAPGRTYRIDFNTGVHSPSAGTGHGRFARDRNSIYAWLPSFTDGRGNPGHSLTSTATTTLSRNGELIATLADDLDWGGAVTVPAAAGAYTLATTITRDQAIADVATRIEGRWTFESAETATWTELPFSTVRFRPAVDLASRAPAGRLQTFPVTVEGSAAGPNLKALAVSVSYDGGTTWRPVTVTGGRITVRNPAAGRGLALRAEIADRQGNTAAVTVHDAYRGR
ncbi:S8 family serine peptidase [Streptomyces sp. NPDC020875]|uniref:S8 family serine peptidase n=1 Tax=Streptomyces sp. NPDC020875 TaxID=3154898 RepID=UPI0033CB841E